MNFNRLVPKALSLGINQFFSRSIAFSISRSFGLPNIMTSQKLDKVLAKKLIDETDNFLFDCDGVLWDGIGAISGSVETIAQLKRLGKKVFYVTNNSTSSREDYLKKCAKFGFAAEEADIVCTAFAAALYLHNMNFKGKVYVIGNQAMGKELDKYNINHIGIGPDDSTTGDDSAYSSRVQAWLATELDPEVNCVLVGFDPYINVTKIMKAASYLQREGCIFLGTNEDTHLPTKGSDIVIPGTGTMVMAVSVPARRKPVIVGKPESTMFDVLSKANNLDPARSMMVGDRMNTDIVMAKRCKLKSLLVLTGVCSEEDLPQGGVKPQSFEACEEVPDFYAERLGVFGNFIADL